MKRTLFALSVLSVGILAGLVISGRLSATESSAAAPAPPQGRSNVLPTTAALPDLSAVAERALKVAVNISSRTVTRLNDPFLQRMLGDQAEQSLGSGVVVSADGYILTNDHVIGGAGGAGADIRVTLPDGTEKPAKLIGVDGVTDLAVVKVDAQNLQTLPWGDSGKLRIAEWVLAVGNPYQLSGTVTLGIVSTVSRSGDTVGAYADFIQTDAAINPGNSGGALVNSRGELVGINAMIISGTQGIGFAIPSRLARQIMDELIQNGAVLWGSLGDNTWATADSRLARRFDLGTDQGVLVYRLEDNSAALRAGLRAGDVIVAVNGVKVTDADQFDLWIIKATPGTTAKLDIVRRDGRRATVNVPVTSRARIAVRGRD